VRSNEGMTGNVLLDEYADREPEYWITDMAANGTFVKIAEVVNIDLQTRVSQFVDFAFYHVGIGRYHILSKMFHHIFDKLCIHTTFSKYRTLDTMSIFRE